MDLHAVFSVSPLRNNMNVVLRSDINFSIVSSIAILHIPIHRNRESTVYLCIASSLATPFLLVIVFLAI